VQRSSAKCTATLAVSNAKVDSDVVPAAAWVAYGTHDLPCDAYTLRMRLSCLLCAKLHIEDVEFILLSETTKRISIRYGAGD